MQDRYTGDIGDYGKLGLLRILRASGMSVGVNWYLTPNETHNDDGCHTGYLENEAFRCCDEQLWHELKRVVDSGRRSVSALEKKNIIDAEFFSDCLDFKGMSKERRRARRSEWHSKALEALSRCDMVFLDPDNGLIVPSAEQKPEENKYVLPKEITDYYSAGASVIYYQHKARRKDEFYKEQHKRLLCLNALAGAAGAGLKFRTTSQRFYFFIMQPCHRESIYKLLLQLTETSWGTHFSLI